MNILQLNTNFRRGGIQRHVLDLADWLEGRGHVCHVGGTAGDWANPETRPGFLDLPIVGVSWEGGNIAARGLTALHAARKLRRFLIERDIDLIHAHESAPAIVANIARRGLKVPLVVTYHGSAPDRVSGFARIARRADHVVTPSHASSDDLRTIGRVRPDKLSVIGLGLRPPPPANGEEIGRLRSELLGDGDRLVVTIARITRQKGVDVLIDCVSRLKSTHPGIRFALVGTGPEEAQMHQKARMAGLEGHLTFVGQSDRPHDYLRAADLFLLTSRWESLPYTIPEAFQVGCPAIATACSGVVELIDDKVGRVVPVGDVDKICAAVAEIAGDDALRAKMSARALERSREGRFDPEVTHQSFLKLYQRLTAS